MFGPAIWGVVGILETQITGQHRANLRIVLRLRDYLGLLYLCAALEYWSETASSTWVQHRILPQTLDSSGWNWSACALGPRTPQGAATLLAGSMMESKMQRRVSQEQPPAAASVAGLTQPQSATSGIVAAVVRLCRCLAQTSVLGIPRRSGELWFSCLCTCSR